MNPLSKKQQVKKKKKVCVFFFGVFVFLFRFVCPARRGSPSDNAILYINNNIIPISIQPDGARVKDLLHQPCTVLSHGPTQI